MEDLVTRLRDRGVKVTEIPKWGPYLQYRCGQSFASHLNEREKEEIYLYERGKICGYLWHVFSYETVTCLKGEQARGKLEQMKNMSCYIFYEMEDSAYIIDRVTSLKALDFERESDIYVVDVDFTWTYIRTHENPWYGPYFYHHKEVERR
ncbi:DUF4275 family protein [Cytobacillus kochii]|uniref:DUF4275 family protein n=1 Tax=Cytobacillus kochii TaxID=859143 RepID=UPI001CD27396|nr:DUF4275 family protein [Cytobacillus kochii]MCA1028095.1 DUF4275 family protein [Cytobacillus kochii]MCM3324005.1 DUF4275 family protein [Cytobacillus kochii]MCM3346401.1 DUF4275 family protein [Cytobacillus kochii]MDM5205725.1 DUF4275 family protein [Cytobacillus kochii]